MFETSSIDNPAHSQSTDQDWIACKKQEILQALNRAMDPVISDELDKIKEERPDTKKRIEEKDARIRMLEEINADKDKSILELKQKLKHAQEYINTVEQCKLSGDPTPMFKYEYDLTDYSQDTECMHVDWLFNTLYELCTIPLDASTMLIENQTSVVIIYIVLHDSLNLKNTVFEFTGTLVNFVDSWNANVAARIEDEERRKALTVNYSTVKSTLSKAPWKGVAQGSWRSLSFDTSNRNRKTYAKGYNIKSRLESRLLNSKFSSTPK